MLSKRVVIQAANLGASLIDMNGLWLNKFIQEDEAFAVEYDRNSDSALEYVIYAHNGLPRIFRGVLMAQHCVVHDYTPAYFSIAGHLFDNFQPMSEKFGRNTGVFPWRTEYSKRTVKQEELSGEMHVGFALFEDVTVADKKDYMMLFALQHSEHLDNVELFCYGFTASSPLAVFNYVSEIYAKPEQLLIKLDADCYEERDTKKRFELLLTKFVKNIEQVKHRKYVNTCDSELDNLNIVFNICNVNISVFFGLDNLAEKEEDFAFSNLKILIEPNAGKSEFLDLLGEETIKDIVTKNAMHLFRSGFKEIVREREMQELPY